MKVIFDIAPRLARGNWIECDISGLRGHWRRSSRIGLVDSETTSLLRVDPCSPSSHRGWKITRNDKVTTAFFALRLRGIGSRQNLTAAEWLDRAAEANCSPHMDETLPNTTLPTQATLFRDEAEQARRYAAAMTDKIVIDRLNRIAVLYDELAAGQDLGPTDRD